jgi:hypothetical protein
MALSFNYPNGLARTIISRVLIMMCVFVAAVIWLGSFEEKNSYSGRIRFFLLHRGATYMIDDEWERIVVPYASNGEESFWSAIHMGDSLSISDPVVVLWRKGEEPKRYRIG